MREAERTARAEQTADKLLERGKLFARVGDYTRASQYLTAALDAGAKPDEVLPTLMRVFVGQRRSALQSSSVSRAHEATEKHALRFLVGRCTPPSGVRISRASIWNECWWPAETLRSSLALGVLLRDAESRSGRRGPTLSRISQARAHGSSC